MTPDVWNRPELDGTHLRGRLARSGDVAYPDEVVHRFRAKSSIDDGRSRPGAKRRS